LAAVAPFVAATSPGPVASDADAPDVDRPPAGSIRIYGRPDRGWLYLAGGNAPMTCRSGKGKPVPVQTCR
jgi:hypothetical protein